jgi:hypothetical protein
VGKIFSGDLDTSFTDNIIGFSPRVVTGEKNSPTVAHACRKRRLKWVLPQIGGLEHRASNPVSVKNLTTIEALCSSGNEED